MRPTIHTLHTPLALAAWHAVERALHALGTALRRLRAARRTHDALAGLDDRTLRDLGIDRSEIAAYANKPDDPHRARAGRPGRGLQ
jgi:uncharacterized protein YjiS (DUF1127 family)